MVTQEEILHRFLTEGGREDAKFLKGTPGYGLHVDNEGQLCFFVAGRRNQREEPLAGADEDGVVLARFVGNRFAPAATRGAIILNGDGFDDFRSTDWQIRLRQLVQNPRQPGWTIADNIGCRVKWALIPYQALDGARIDKSTISVIEQTADAQEVRWQIRRFNYDTVVKEITAQGRRDEPSWSYNTGTASNATRREFQNSIMVGGREYTLSINDAKITGVWSNNGRMVHWLPENAPRANWHNLEFVTQGWTHDETIVVDETGIPRTVKRGEPVYPDMAEKETVAVWQETVHRLGACIFSAVGIDGERHTFISAFDQQEPQPLYFLAQLTDDTKVKHYHEAIAALAPPLVHAARAEGKEVYRHGDVFAIEVAKTDEDFDKEDVAAWVQREVVLAPNQFGRNAGYEGYDSSERYSVFDDPCPHCTDFLSAAEQHSYPQANGPTARRWLSIYRTGHTADEVIVLRDGRTFLKGVMHHDPQLEDPERTTGDHQVIALGNSNKWFLAVRNTVPAQVDPDATQDTPSGAAVEGSEEGTTGQGSGNGAEGDQAAETVTEGQQVPANDREPVLAEAVA